MEFRKWFSWRILFFALWIAIGAAAIAFLPLGVWLKQLTAWIQSLGWIAPFAYIVTYLLFCIFLIPSIALSTGVAPAFGFVNGLFYTVMASNLGGTVAFLLGRTVLRARVERWARDKPRFNAIDQAVERSALSIVTLLRMSPMFPFTILNYVLALTRVTYWKFALGTFCGMLPLNAAMLYIGCEALKAVDDVQRKDVDTLKVSLRIAGIVATVAALAVVSRIALRAIKGFSAQNAESRAGQQHH